MNTPPKSPQPKTPRNILYAVRASALGAFVSILITPPFVFGEDLFGKHTTLFGLGILLVASLQLILLSRHAAWKFLQPLARIAQNKWVMLFGNIPVLLTSVASIIIAFIFSKLILGTFMMMLIIGGVFALLLVAIAVGLLTTLYYQLHTWRYWTRALRKDTEEQLPVPAKTDSKHGNELEQEKKNVRTAPTNNHAIHTLLAPTEIPEKIPKALKWAAILSTTGCVMTVIFALEFAVHDLFMPHLLFSVPWIILAGIQLVLLSRHVRSSWLSCNLRIAKNKWFVFFGTLMVFIASVLLILPTLYSLLMSTAYLGSNKLMGLFILIRMLGLSGGLLGTLYYQLHTWRYWTQVPRKAARTQEDLPTGDLSL